MTAVSAFIRKEQAQIIIFHNTKLKKRTKPKLCGKKEIMKAKPKNNGKSLERQEKKKPDY